MVAYETYASALITKGHGHPLWEPDPGDYPGVELGDVGFIDEGGFIRLFNASAGNDDPRNHFGLPQGHSRLLTGRIKRRTPLPKEPRYIASKGIQSTGVDLSITAGAFGQAGGGVSFECSRKQGGLLILGDPAYREDAVERKRYCKYITENHRSWLEFASQLGYDLSLSDLILVYGCDKTSQWACAAWSEQTQSVSLSFVAGVPGIVGGGARLWGEWISQQSLDQNIGPQPLVPTVEGEGNSFLQRNAQLSDTPSIDQAASITTALPIPTRLSNQCVFVRGYQMGDRTTWFKRKMTRIDVGSGFKIVPKPLDSQKKTAKDFDGSHRPQQQGPSAPAGSSQGDTSSATTRAMDLTYQSEDEDEESSDSDDGNTMNIDEISTPVDVLMGYIFQNSAAEFALVHHDDFKDYLKGSSDSGARDYNAWIQQSAPVVYVDNGIGMFEGMHNLVGTQNSPEDVHDRESLDTPSGGVLTLRDVGGNIDVDRHATNLFSSIVYHFLTHQGQVDAINASRDGWNMLRQLQLALQLALSIPMAVRNHNITYMGGATVHDINREFSQTINSTNDGTGGRLAVALRARRNLAPPQLLSRIIGSRSSTQTTYAAGSLQVISPFSVMSPDRQQITTSFAEGDEVAKQRNSQSNAQDCLIEATTLESLIAQLITNSSYGGKGLEYWDTFFTTYSGFTTADDVFQTLVRLFEDAESSPAEHRTFLRINIITAMKYWATNPYLTVDTTVLARMQEFSMSICGSLRMSDLATELHLVVTKRLRPLPHSPPQSHRVASMPPNPRDLAIALMMLEGEKYSRIIPGDYISYLQHPEANNNIAIACKTNDQIVNLVKVSVLRCDDLNARSAVLKLFVHAAEESHKLCNFASMLAIVTALQSPMITRLRLTRDRLPRDVKRRVDQMGKVLDPHHNHAAYKDLLSASNSLSCIPWLALHIPEIHIAFSERTDTIEIQSVPMINFAKWTRCYDRIKDVFRYKSPDTSEYRQTKAGALAYLEGQLHISANSTTDQDLEERSIKLERQEMLPLGRF